MSVRHILKNHHLCSTAVTYLAQRRKKKKNGLLFIDNKYKLSVVRKTKEHTNIKS